MSDDSACDACGARLAPGATTCDLCGQPVGAPVDESKPTPTSELDRLALKAQQENQAGRAMPMDEAHAAGGDGAGPDPNGGVFCHACGWKNPPGARFCSRCGTALQSATSAPGAAIPAFAPPTTVPEAAVPAQHVALGPRLSLYVGAAVLLVGGLYLATVASRDQGEAAPTLTPQAQAPAGTGPAPPAPGSTDGAFAPLAPESERQVAALEAEAAGLTGAAKASKQTELTNLLIGLGRPDRAAEIAEATAQAAGTPEAWRRAADLLYRWMEALPEAQRGTVAPRVVAAYDRVLATSPDDLDARTNVGWAAQYDATGNPMRAITETNEVLRRDSLHLGASYNRGWFLRAIGRFDGAIAQFEKVRRLAGPDSPLGREAQLMIEGVRQQQGAASSAPTGSATATPREP